MSKFWISVRFKELGFSVSARTRPVKWTWIGTSSYVDKFDWVLWCWQVDTHHAKVPESFQAEKPIIRRKGGSRFSDEHIRPNKRDTRLSCRFWPGAGDIHRSASVLGTMAQGCQYQVGSGVYLPSLCRHRFISLSVHGLSVCLTFYFCNFLLVWTDEFFSRKFLAVVSFQ